jgi:butyrate kinase
MEDKKILILAINPGSTSTKIGVFLNEKQVHRKSIEHASEDLARYPRVVDQYEIRKDAVLDCLNEWKIKAEDLSVVVARGGAMPPIKGGAYRVNEKMVGLLKTDKLPEHASNVAAVIAYDIAAPQGIPAMIYDGVSTDELSEVARISGMADIDRVSLSHALNTRAVARKVAQDIGKSYQQANLIVAHLGGGITVSLHKQGRMVDIVSDDEGPFSPERAGRVPCRQLIDLCYSGRFDHSTMRKKLRGKGGLVSYLETNNAQQVQKMVENGDKKAELIYYAMAYQIAKAIGELATVVQGKVDRIVLTGGIAYSEQLTGWISENVSFIAPVLVVPGENELEALALGGLRVVREEEGAHEFDIEL